MTDGPLIVQSDKTLLLEVDHPGPRRRGATSRRSPSSSAPRAHPHLPRHPARAVERPRRRARRRAGRRRAGATQPVCRAAGRCSSTSPTRWPATAGSRLDKDPAHGLVLVTTDRPVLEEVLRHKKIARCSASASTTDTVLVHPSRARPPQAGAAQDRLARRGSGRLRRRRGAPDHLREDGWALRPYQEQAVEGFWHGGSGVVVLPCGAGKTIVGAGAMAAAGATTLILVTNTVAARQWKDELLRRTSLTEDEIGEYSGARKEIRPVTIATYQVLTTRRKGAYTHLELLDARDWGLDRLRRGAPAARADLPDDRRPAGPPPPRADRDPGARGRPRGRRLLAHRAEALRRAVEGHRGAGLDRPGGLRRGAGHAAETSGWRTPWPSPRSATGSPRARRRRTRVVEELVAGTPASRRS
jgi:DNA excision repair protein ERCC-3